MIPHALGGVGNEKSLRCANENHTHIVLRSNAEAFATTSVKKVAPPWGGGGGGRHSFPKFSIVLVRLGWAVR